MMVSILGIIHLISYATNPDILFISIAGAVHPLQALFRGSGPLQVRRLPHAAAGGGAASREW